MFFEVSFSIQFYSTVIHSEPCCTLVSLIEMPDFTEAMFYYKSEPNSDKYLLR